MEASHVQELYAREADGRAHAAHIKAPKAVLDQTQADLKKTKANNAQSYAVNGVQRAVACFSFTILYHNACLLKLTRRSPKTPDTVAKSEDEEKEKITGDKGRDEGDEGEEGEDGVEDT
ncbi:hypothetical protein F4776DRAFT_660735 [Hypoxylon sp. NC0597]|nr:hypothetical protein F4776DRAFT_660735 [Hypoxylon sp. NC0597]